MTYVTATAGSFRPGRELDPDALGQHVDRLYRAAYFMCGSRDEAEDLVQETFARVLRRPRILRADDDIGYLLRALRNTFYSAKRAADRRPQMVALPDAPAVHEDPSADRGEETLELVELYEAIAALPDMFRDAVLAIDLLGLSYREAARALGVREATITTRLHRARQRLASSIAG
jgi:RNA polymerase sigma-70 factor (ECF subfamily)